MRAIPSKDLNIGNSTLVPGAGIEPARPYGHKILSLGRLPIPPSRPTKIKFGGDDRSRTDLKGFADLCLTAWLRRPWSEKRDSNSRPRPWQGRALPAELFPRKTLTNDQPNRCQGEIENYISADRFIIKNNISSKYIES